MGAAAAMGVMTAAGSVALADDAAPEPGRGTYEDWEPLGLDLPWGGPGSEAGDWQGTPDDIKALGGSTMPLDELNRRRRLYIDAQTDYTCAGPRSAGRCGPPPVQRSPRNLGSVPAWVCAQC